MSAYTIALPPGWQRIPLDGYIASHVAAIMDEAVTRVPKEVPPDQVKPMRRQFETALVRQLEEARANGGVDYYLPVDLMHGQLVSASLMVTSVVPDANAEPGLAQRVMAQLLTDEGARPVSLGDTIWVRTERLREREADEFHERSRAREVEYRTFAPDEEARWIVVTGTTMGDGDPTGEVADLLIELIDAMMSNWRWVQKARAGA